MMEEEPRRAIAQLHGMELGGQVIQVPPARSGISLQPWVAALTASTQQIQLAIHGWPHT